MTDWYQTVIDPVQGTSEVKSGNIKQGSPWRFFSLADLPMVNWRIPDLAPAASPGRTIYCAVNLDVYLKENPGGFLDGRWKTGQTLTDLDIEITQGRIPGVHGIMRATTDFIFDPLSPTGFVPQGGAESWLDSRSFCEQFGDIAIIAVHESVLLENPEQKTDKKGSR